MSKILPLNAELQKIADQELGERPERIAEDLAALRLWMQHQPHLKVRDDDQFLVQFLRGCKYSLEKAKKKLDLFFSLKTKYPEMLHAIDVDNPKFRETASLGCFVALPKPLHGTGPRIIVFRFNYSTSKYGIDAVTLPACSHHELMLVNDPYACISGIAYIVDFALATTSHYLQMTPNVCKKLMSFLEQSLPLRIKAVYYINANTAAQQFFKILFPFLSEKLRQRVHVMGNNMAELHQHIPPQYLPKDYDGELPSLDQLTAEASKSWDENRDFFKANANYGSDESLRPGKPLDIDGLFGVGGSFRKLVVD